VPPAHHEVIISAIKRGGAAKARRIAQAMRHTLGSPDETAALIAALEELEKGPSGKARNLDPDYLKTLDILDATEAAAYLRSSPSTLAKYRMAPGGPRFIRQSARKVLYRRSDLDAWLNEHSRITTIWAA
jgi:hypothetical protein